MTFTSGRTYEQIQQTFHPLKLVQIPRADPLNIIVFRIAGYPGHHCSIVIWPYTFLLADSMLQKP
jgi:hypothetical protein